MVVVNVSKDDLILNSRQQKQTSQQLDGSVVSSFDFLIPENK